MIDFHCHLDLYPNVMSFIKDVEERNQYTLVVTTSPRAWLASSQVFSKYTNIECALGLHPEILPQKFHEKELLLKNIPNCRFIGEVGIDGSKRYESSLESQAALFKEVVRCANDAGGRILSIHSRKAESIVITIIEENNSKNIPILHWYTGSKTILIKALSLGCLFSIGPAMVSTSKGKQLISSIPLDRILPESDGPFAKINGKPVMPWESMSIVTQLSEIYSTSESIIADQIKSNYQSLLLEADKKGSA